MSNLEIKYRKAYPIDVPEARYKGFKPETILLKKGSIYKKGYMPLPCDIIKERDVAVKMRDGITIYVDIYRPVTDKKIPAILNWAPYGKGDTGEFSLEAFPNMLGIPKSSLSGLQSWEGSDPAFWCQNGYAVVHADARGTFNSEGDISYFGSQEGRDGYDTIEHIAKMSWCNGKVGMAGNSWLAIAQWKIAELCPPHLAAIAPWEGLTDPYRDVFARCGVEDTQFPEKVLLTLRGKNNVEDVIENLKLHPLFDDYWADKKVDTSKINIPVYCVSSYANPIHVTGTCRGWRDLTETRKWLRIHNMIEWTDYYKNSSRLDLKKFFDRYLKDIHNNWEETPEVRISVLNPGHKDKTDIAEKSYPPQNLQSDILYLNNENLSLTKLKCNSNAKRNYDLNKCPNIDYIYTFDKATEIIGFPKLKLYLSVSGGKDTDVFVQLQKLNSHGKQVFHQTAKVIPAGDKILPIAKKMGVKALDTLFFAGADGMLRASRRKLASDGDFPEFDGTSEEFLSEGQIVEVTIPIQSIAMRWEKGESLRLRISGHSVKAPSLPGITEPPHPKYDKTFVYSGNKYPSRLIYTYR